MSTLSRSEEKIRLEDLHSYDQEDIGSYCSLSGERSVSPVCMVEGLRGQHGVMEQEKRIRREIANSNERRRMQSINAGFQSLRTLLPHHEGEKLSKAAILQQTAEYIYQLEQEKTRLLSQNCQLKRLINQHEGEANTATKKRKTESGVVVAVGGQAAIVSESSDEGLSLSPEPVAMVAANNTNITANPAAVVTDMEVDAQPAADLLELRVQLDRERGLRLILEDQVRSLETQLYPERIREITHNVQLQYHQHTDQHEELPPTLITPVRRESQSSNSSNHSASIMHHQETAQAITTLEVVARTETVMSSSPVSPQESDPARLPSILEAAIKAEPRVEVERLPSPPSKEAEDIVPTPRVYLASTSRQNLETIVEAIRHLEGDHLFSDSSSVGEKNGSVTPVVSRHITIQSTALTEAGETGSAPPQEAPLALTKHPAPTRLLKVEMNPFLHFHPATQQQHRPGVIVVKQNT